MPGRRTTPLTSATTIDVMQQIENAADTITRTGHVLQSALGVKWGNKSLMLYRQIMEYQRQAKEAIEADRLAVEAGKGTRVQGERRPRAWERAGTYRP